MFTFTIRMYVTAICVLLTCIYMRSCILLQLAPLVPLNVASFIIITCVTRYQAFIYKFNLNA